VARAKPWRCCCAWFPDRGLTCSGRSWTLTFAGYALTVVCVPALAITPFLAGAGLAVAFVLAAGNGTGQTVGGAGAGPARDH